MGQYLKFFAVLAVIYAIFAGAFAVFRHEFIYLFVDVGAPPADMPRTEVKYIPQTFDAPRLEVWITEPLPGKPVILYFMGGSGALSVHEPRLREFASRGFGLAAMAYRGGGGQAGRPTEAGLNQDAARLYAALDTLFGREIPPSDRVIYGYALGSALAVRLAADEDEMALVLEAPFGSMCEMMQKVVVILPACRLMWDERYNSKELIDQVDTTVLFLHGGKDTIIPLEMGAALYNAAVEPKFTKIYRQGGHIDLARFGATEDISQFINTLRGGT
ncbi:MAG: alpha/beta hydrolase [Pseudomonadota bacterium]